MSPNIPFSGAICLIDCADGGQAVPRSLRACVAGGQNRICTNEVKKSGWCIRLRSIMPDDRQIFPQKLAAYMALIPIFVSHLLRNSYNGKTKFTGRDTLRESTRECLRRPYGGLPGGGQTYRRPDSR